MVRVGGHLDGDATPIAVRAVLLGVSFAVLEGDHLLSSRVSDGPEVDIFPAGVLDVGSAKVSTSKSSRDESCEGRKGDDSSVGMHFDFQKWGLVKK